MVAYVNPSCWAMVCLKTRSVKVVALPQVNDELCLVEETQCKCATDYKSRYYMVYILQSNGNSRGNMLKLIRNDKTMCVKTNRDTNQSIS